MNDLEKLAGFSPDELLYELKRRENAAKAVPEAADGEQLMMAEVRIMADHNPLAAFTAKDLSVVLHEKQKLIYGVDDRTEVRSAPDDARDDVDCVVALFKAENVVDNGNGTSTLRTTTFAAAYELCTSEPFRLQPCGAYCSGFLVAPDIVATAGHCMRPEQFRLDKIRFVFGLRLDASGQAPTVVSNDEIYRAVDIIDYRYTNAAEDWGLVRLDRPVLNHAIARLRRNGKVPDQAAVHVVGHPCGLPAKYADGAEVRDNTPSAFLANLDTYGGNSGSPVFNSADHVVEGILVRGDNDFVRVGTCRVSNVCPAAGCSGESVTRSTEFANQVP